MTKKKPKKERAEHYEPKLKIKGSFDDVINLSVGKEVKKDEKKKDKK